MTLKAKLYSVDIIKNYKKLWPFIRPYKFKAILALIITIPLGSMDALIAWILKPYMDHVMVEKQFQTSIYLPLVIIFLSLFQSVLAYSSTYLNTWVGSKITNDLKTKLFIKMMRYEAPFFDKATSGEIQFRFNQDVNSACSGLLINVKTFTTRFFATISLLAVLFINSWQLAIIASSALFFALYPLSRVRKMIKAIMSKVVFSGAKVMTHYNEAFGGNRVVTSYNLYDYNEKRFKNTLNEVFKLEMKMTRKMGMLTPMMHVIVSIGISGVMWYGGYLITHNQLSVGGFVSFITALLMLYQPIKSLGSTYTQVQQSILAIERVFELVSREPKIKSLEKAVFINGIEKSISFKNVNFSYDNKRNILKDISFEIPKGKTVALVGESGGGKSTIVNLIPRFYEVSSGDIKIDDINIKNINLENLRENISIVFQDNFLFTGTIKENILLGLPNIDEAALNEVIKKACLDEFVASLENGINTEIGERGILLSGGQKQRVAIARSMIKNAPIVILDEATSALDNKSEALVQKALNNLSNNRTVFIIAHRLSTIKNADIILVISKGKVAEQGTHESLVENENSIYHKLYNSSFV